MSKKVYTAFSIFEILWTLVLRMICVIFLIYILVHYEENPTLIIIIAVICLLLILFIGDDQITVYTDKIIQNTNSFGSLIFNNNGTTLKLENIKVAYLETTKKSSVKELGMAGIIAFLLPIQNKNRDKKTLIYFELNSGEILNFETNLEKSKLIKIVELVNSLK